MRVLAIVTARGGSKGVPRKNIRLLCGKPLLQYTAEAALATHSLARVVLSTDDEEIAQVGRDCGLEVPFLRPPELARDDTPTLPVLQHAVRFLEENGAHFDAICLLQPTNPLRCAADIDGCIALWKTGNADAVATVLPVPAEHNPHWVYFQADDGALFLSTGEDAPLARRQQLPAAYHREGAVYVVSRDALMQRNTLYGSRLLGYEMDAARSINIDTMDDWRRAEELLCGREL